MAGQKLFVGSRLRQFRRERKQTQLDMARALELSPAYVNLLENNQRSLSVAVLMRLSEVYGVDWRDLTEDDSAAVFADLRTAFQDPVFGGAVPDRQELRAALDHCPTLSRALVQLHKSYRTLTERLLAAGDGTGSEPDALVATSPETVVHDFFRRRRNYFAEIEEVALAFRREADVSNDEFYSHVKRHLARRLGIAVTTSVEGLPPGTLRYYDEESRTIALSHGLDYPNRVFQLTHVAGLISHSDLFDRLIAEAGVSGTREHARCRVELANYFAAAVLMPYDDMLAEAATRRYDIDDLAARFGVSYEQACHRLTTLQREGAQGVPFFFLRIDRAGNVTKRFSAASFHLAEYGGACPKWDIHLCFRTPGRILPQFVEMPDGARFFTINRTVDRPTLGHQTQDYRLAVTLGCPIDHADRIVYARQFQLDQPGMVTPIGINCRLCPRHNCAQRAHQPLHLDLPIDERRRGQTRFES